MRGRRPSSAALAASWLDGPPPSLAAVCDAIRVDEPRPRRPPEAPAGRGPRRCSCQRELGTDPAAPDRLLRQLAAQLLEVPRADARRFATAWSGCWLAGRALAPRFAADVQAVARAVRDGVFGDRKVFISGGLGPAAARAGVVGDLARRLQARLVVGSPRRRRSCSRARTSSPRWIRACVAASETVADGASFHFIVREPAMTQLTTLDTAEITTWLTRVTQTIDRSLRDGARAEALAALGAGLEGTSVALPVLAQLALLDDCLRVAHLAIEADGRIERDELARVADLVRDRRRQVLRTCCRATSRSTTARRRPPRSSGSCARTVRIAAPFGYVDASHWRGLHARAARRAATRTTRRRCASSSACSRASWTTVFAGRATEVEREARAQAARAVRAAARRPAPIRARSRSAATTGPEVFSSVAHGSQIHERDPFDVEAIHAEAREVFHRQLERATTPEQHAARPRPHAARARRVRQRQDPPAARAAHPRPRAAARLRRLPADDVGGRRLRALRAAQPDRLARAAVRRAGAVRVGAACICPTAWPRAASRSAATSSSGCAPPSSTRDELDDADRPDGRSRRCAPKASTASRSICVHALLLLQRRDPALQRRVIRFLRCEPLSAYDSSCSAGSPRATSPRIRCARSRSSRRSMLRAAARRARAAGRSDRGDRCPTARPSTRIQQAFDVLRAIADAVPSAVVVIACLDDVYDAVRPQLSRSLVDRLERDPAPVRLASQRERDEIEADAGAPPRAPVRGVRRRRGATTIRSIRSRRRRSTRSAKLRARDCLAKFREYHERVHRGRRDRRSPTALGRADRLPTARAAASVELDRAWNDALAATAERPRRRRRVLALVARGDPRRRRASRARSSP